LIPFSPPRIDQKIIDEVVDTLKSGWITTGPKTKRFEKELEAYTGSKRVLCLNSATAGLEIMLRWFGVKEGDEVILPAYTYIATANVIMHCGATPVFVDVNASDFNISVEKIRAAITPKTKVIIPVDFAGLPCDYDKINELVSMESIRKQFSPDTPEQKQLGRILVLSDSAHSIGGWLNGKRVGALTDVSVISFHAVKNLTTAEGGCVCLNLEGFDNDKLYVDLCIKTLHGQNKDALEKMQPGNWKYDILEPGYKFNMTDILASIGLVELARYDSDTLPKRKEICTRYMEGFSHTSWVQLPIFIQEEKESSYHLFPLRILNITEMQRDAIIASIVKHGVSVNVHFIPVPMMSFYKKMGYDINNYPQTRLNYEAEISLPVYYGLKAEEVDIVIDVVCKSVKEIIG
jgi:dTDP-4-amino-4,6-dideoxygalactose transaminase